MTASELSFIKQIFEENTISHCVKYSGRSPVDVYTVSTSYRTKEGTIRKNLVTVTNTKDTALFEVLIGGSCVFAKNYRKAKPIKLTDSNSLPDEDEVILDLLKLCDDKVTRKYLNQLKEIKSFLDDLKNSNIK